MEKFQGKFGIPTNTRISIPRQNLAHSLSTLHRRDLVRASYEITYTRSRLGRRYDVRGNLENWWDVITAQQFEEKSKRLETQYSAIRVPEAGKQVCNDFYAFKNINVV